MLIGNGGSALWEAFRRSPESGAGPDPLDAYTRRVVTEAVGALGHELPTTRHRVRMAFEQEGGVHADFVDLARQAGLGARSRLGLLLHPRYGPWFALRAAILSEAVIEAKTPVAPPGFDPCAGCPAPCADACPGSALASGRFDVVRCQRHRAVDPACAGSCAARRACVVGREFAYPAEALAHHMRHARLP